jgi:hypothetical protein
MNDSDLVDNGNENPVWFDSNSPNIIDLNGGGIVDTTVRPIREAVRKLLEKKGLIPPRPTPPEEPPPPPAPEQK